MHDNGQPGRFLAPHLVAIGRIHFKLIRPGTQAGIHGTSKASGTGLRPSLFIIFQPVFIISVGRVGVIQPGKCYGYEILIITKFYLVRTGHGGRQNDMSLIFFSHPDGCIENTKPCQDGAVGSFFTHHVTGIEIIKPVCPSEIKHPVFRFQCGMVIKHPALQPVRHTECHYGKTIPAFSLFTGNNLTYTIQGRSPHYPVTVLQNGRNRIVRQPFGHREQIKTFRLFIPNPDAVLRGKPLQTACVGQQAKIFYAGFIVFIFTCIGNPNFVFSCVVIKQAVVPQCGKTIFPCGTKRKNQLKVLQRRMPFMQHKLNGSVLRVQQPHAAIHADPIISMGVFIQCPRHILRHVLLGIALAS